LAKQAKVIEMLKDMEEREVIKESDSPRLSLVCKKNGNLRFYVDCGKLYDVIKNDFFPLPRIDDAVDTLAGTKCFSSLHLKCGCW
jgi:hypothetical protein